MTLIFALVLAIMVISLLANETISRNLTLQTARIPVLGLDKTYESFSVLHIGDLHATASVTGLEDWRALLFTRRFDAVVFSGDMVGKSGDFGPMISLIETLKIIKPTVPIYFLAGDDDPIPLDSTYRGTPEVYASWVLAARSAGAIYLDAPVSQPIGKLNVWFAPEYLYTVDAKRMLGSLAYQKQEMEAQGLPYETEGGARYRALLAQLDAMERTVEALNAMTDKDMQIAVCHAPLSVDYMRTAVEWAPLDHPFSIRRVNLVMAGHYVSGQWRLLGLGPVYVPEVGWFPGDAGVVGLQRVNSVNQYITGGLGASSFNPLPGRLFNPPNASLLTFTARIE